MITISKIITRVPPFYLGPLILIAANVCYAISFSLAKWLTLDVSIWIIMLFRFLAGPIFVGPYLLKHPSPISIHHHWRPLLIRIICGISAMTFLFFGFNYGDIGRCTIIFESAIIWTLILDALVSRHYPSRKTLACLPLLFIGILWMSPPNLYGPIQLGEWLAFLGAICNAGVYVSLAKLRQTQPTSIIVFWTYSISACVLLLPAWPSITTLSITTLLSLSVMSSIGCVGQLCMTMGFKYAHPGISSIFMLSIIPLTTFSGMIFFNETYSWLNLFGITIIFGCLAGIAKWR